MEEEGIRRMRRPTHVRLMAVSAVAAVAAAALVAAASARPATHAGAGADPSNDKLAQILARGTLLLSTDPAYPPQSYRVASAKRATHTRCASNQLTANQVGGYDAETGKLVAKALGVEPCFVTPTWSDVISGRWNDRWDVSFGSGAITSDRMERLWMTQPYYANPQEFFVATKSHYRKPSDLNGKRVGVCAGCSQLLYMRGALQIPGERIRPLVKNAKISVFDVEGPGLKALAAGKIDAFLCNATVGTGAVREEGLKLRALPGPAFFEYEAGFVDKASALAVGPFLKRLNTVVRTLQANGTMKRLSLKFFGADYATKAASFNLASIGQRAP